MTCPYWFCIESCSPNVQVSVAMLKLPVNPDEVVKLTVPTGPSSPTVGPLTSVIFVIPTRSFPRSGEQHLAGAHRHACHDTSLCDNTCVCTQLLCSNTGVTHNGPASLFKRFVSPVPYDRQCELSFAVSFEPG